MPSHATDALATALENAARLDVLIDKTHLAVAQQQRSQLWWNGVAEMPRMHEIDWRHFSFLYGSC